MTETTGATPPLLPPTEEEKTRAGFRLDLIQRLFAVAISVGAATTLAQMPWVQTGRWPCLSEWQQLFILIAAMMATVLSWDGYLWSTRNRPLTNIWRFVIDILLLVIYMFLLMTSKLLTWWLFIHALIYTLYAIWDLLTVHDWLPTYYHSTQEGVRQTIRGVYIGGLKDSADVSRGPIITIVWGVYFWAFYFLNVHGLVNRIFGTTVFVVLALQLYRHDKAKPFTMRRRLGWVVGLLLASVAYVYWGATDGAIWNWGAPYIGSASCGH
jgi:hypothetical protein